MDQHVKYYYDLGFYSNDDMKIFVEAGWITQEQYYDWTGVEYVA